MSNCPLPESLVQKTEIQIKVLRTPSFERKFLGRHTKIYDLHNLAPSPAKDLYMKSGGGEFYSSIHLLEI